jgi:hypothetical protein
MESWAIPEERYKVLLNHRAPIQGVRLDELRRTAIRELFWEIPYDSHVQEGVQVGQPVLEHLNGSVAGHSILDLAQRITGHKTLVQAKSHQGESFFAGLYKRKSS